MKRQGATAYQKKDASSGKTLIEATMAYYEPPPPKPKPAKRKLNQPLPWKNKGKQIAKASALTAELQKQPVVAKSSDKNVVVKSSDSSSGDSPHNHQEKFDDGRQVLTHRLNIGRARVINTEVEPPFSRDLPPSAHFHTTVPKFGSELQRTDGRKLPPPPMPGIPEGQELDVLRGVPKPKPKRPPPAAVSEGTQVNILGAPLRPRAAVTTQPEVDPEERKREIEHFSKVMRAEAKQLEAMKQPKHVDPTDIFGRPLLKRPPPPAAAARQAKEEEEAPFIVGRGERLKPKHLIGGDAFPSYISSPPPESRANIGDGTMVRSRRRGAAAFSGDFEEPEPYVVSPKRGAIVGPSSLAEKEEIPPERKNFYAGPFYRTIMAKCGPWGIRRLRHALRAADTDGDAYLTRTQLQNALLKFGLEVEPSQVATLFTVVGLPPTIEQDKVQQQKVLIPALMAVLRKGHLSLRRKSTIEACYQRLCEVCGKGKGELSVEDMENAMDFSAHPAFQPHIKGSLREVMRGFEQSWGLGKSHSAGISVEEFVNFYSDLSASYPLEDDFVKMMRKMHGLPPAPSQQAQAKAHHKE